MKRFLITLVIVIASCTTAFAVTTTREYSGWKTFERFEISKVEGNQDVYNPQDVITFYLEGKSDKMDVDKQNGFFVSAILYDVPRTGIQNATVKYDTARRAWRVQLKAPADKTKTYEIQLHLYCGKEGSACTDIYGLSAQKERILTFSVR
jgi:hypothetical protein